MAKRGKRVIENKRGASEIDKEIGRRLRLMRVDRSLSQSELGQVLDVSFQQIQKYEKGVNRVTAGRLVDIAVKLNTSPHELLGWLDKKTITPFMDEDTYKLMRAFSKLEDKYKTPIRTLIGNLIAMEASS